MLVFKRVILCEGSAWHNLRLYFLLSLQRHQQSADGDISRRQHTIDGLDGFIVAEQGNVLLICKKEDSSALIRKYLNEMQIRKGDKFV